MKYEKLFKLMQENPDLPVIPMVDCDVVGDDSGCWLGKWGEATLGEYYHADELVYFDDDREDLVQELIDNKYDDEWKGKTDEEMESLAKQIVDGYSWVKCICVRINSL